MVLRLIYRSYGGENRKDRPDFYSKLLTLVSFVRAAAQVPEAEVVFLNDGPIPADRLSVMERSGRVVQIADQPVGMRESYRLGLTMPDRENWPDTDIVSFSEDDYLFAEDAFSALQEADAGLPEASYFTMGIDKPDYEQPGARELHGLPRGWQTQPDRVVGDRVWFNAGSTASTFSARVGALRADLDIFLLCMGPFRRRYLDHETCLLYQGQVPYHGTELLLGLPGDFIPSVRGLARTVYLIPYRFRLNARGRQQHQPHHLYAPHPTLAAHLDLAQLTADQDWLKVARETVLWASEHDLAAAAATLRATVAHDA